MNSDKSIIRLQDPLGEIARKARKNLLAFSFLGLVITELGLIPTEIANLGISFTSSNQASVLLIITGAIIYFLITFFIYSSSDLSAWRMTLKKSAIEFIMAQKWEQRKENIENLVVGANQKSIRRDIEAVEKKEFDAEMEKYMGQFLDRHWSWAWWSSSIRLFIDFAFPVLLSICSITLLIKKIIAF